MTINKAGHFLMNLTFRHTFFCKVAAFSIIYWVVLFTCKSFFVYSTEIYKWKSLVRYLYLNDFSQSVPWIFISFTVCFDKYKFLILWNADFSLLFILFPFISLLFYLFLFSVLATKQWTYSLKFSYSTLIFELSNLGLCSITN